MPQSCSRCTHARDRPTRVDFFHVLRFGGLVNQFQEEPPHQPAGDRQTHHHTHQHPRPWRHHCYPLPTLLFHLPTDVRQLLGITLGVLPLFLLYDVAASLRRKCLCIKANRARDDLPGQSGCG